ncbi:MAG: rRNA maturation RNase YbeY [Pseudomonadota bacterium]
MPADQSVEPLPLAVDCLVEAGGWSDEIDLQALAEKTLAAVLQHPGFTALNVTIRAGSEVSLVFTNDEKIAVLNANHRSKPTPTNVLSFPQNAPKSPIFGPFLGDIVLAYETIEREAALDQKDPSHHVQHLIVHGFLHLLGLDHAHDKEADEMERLEIAILSHLGIDDPYRDPVER